MVKNKYKLLCLSFSALCTTINAQDMPDFRDFIISHAYLNNTQGLIYFKQDLKNDSNKICNDKDKHPEKITMIDQESPSIYRLHDPKTWPPAYNTNLDFKDFYISSKRAAKEIKAHCVDVNLAPVADTQKGSRVYADDFNENKRYVSLFAQAMREEGVVPTYKHFPGMNKIKSVYGTKYDKYYKNIYGEGVIDTSSYDDLVKTTQIFKSDGNDVLMFSVGVYPKIDSRPIVFNDKIWLLAYTLQPNSLYIPDDLSELRLDEDETVELFKRFDMLMYTSPIDANNVVNLLKRKWEDGVISPNDIKIKRDKINKWRASNGMVSY